MEEGFAMLKTERIEEFVRLQSYENVARKLSEEADKFLSGLRAQLTQKEADLFFCLIHKESSMGGAEECLSYQEIGNRLGNVTKQAIAKRVTRLKKNHPDVWEYIHAIRKPKPEVPFSGLSPSERRKEGIDEAYNYDAG